VASYVSLSHFEVKVEVIVAEKLLTLKMHKYVLSLIILMGGFAGTFLAAIARVSSTEQFAGQPFNSQTCESKQIKERKVVSWLANCSQMTVAPIPKTVH
jgi:hypothetical protein